MSGLPYRSQRRVAEASGFGSAPPPSFAARGARIRRWRRAEPLSGPLGAVFFGRRSDGRAPGEGPRKRRPRSKSRRFAAFRISRHLSHLAASFVVGRPEVSIVKSRFFLRHCRDLRPRSGGRGPFGSVAGNWGRRRDGPRVVGEGFPPPRRSASPGARARRASSSVSVGEVIFSLSSRSPRGGSRRAQLRGGGPWNWAVPRSPGRRSAFRVLFGFSGPATGPAFPPSRARTPHGRRFAPMIPPQVHLRRPCYDFSFL